MRRLKTLISGVFLLGLCTVVMSYAPANEQAEFSMEECIAPGQVAMLATVPQNCQSTVYANSAFATGANWTVSGGILVSGQGTLSIVIQPNSFFGSNVTVTCKAFNECAYSTNTDSRTYWIPCF